MNQMRTNPQSFVPMFEEIHQKAIAKGNQLLVVAAKEMVDLLKVQRPLHPLKWEDGLAKGAQIHVKEQGPTRDIGHGRPDLRVKQFGTFKALGENIAYGYKDPVI